MPPRSVDGKARRQTAKTTRTSVARLTCANCRKRKVRCDGQQPECRICQAYERQCQYDTPPSLAQAVAMAKRIEELELKLAEPSAQVTDNNMRSSRDHDMENDDHAATAPNSVETSDSMAVVTGSLATPGSMDTTSAISPLNQSTASMQTTTLTNDTLALSANSHDREQAPMQPINDHQMAFWEAAAIETAAASLHITSTQVSHLLKIHWTWVHPVMLFVPRTKFLRDLASNGPYASKLLLSVLCLHGTRFTHRALASELESQVRLLLATELFSAPTVPAIQSLLQLSAREIGRGEVSLAWNFSGMAFRMSIDMGIFTRRIQTENGSLRARVIGQLAWSCYIWDKALSLYLGRVPTLRDAPNFEPCIVDESAELTPWSPYPVTESGGYANLQPSRLQTSFASFTKLNVILSDILLDVYGPSPSTSRAEILPKLGLRLREWRTQLPAYLLLDAGSSICLPPQVVILNLLYHTSVILLHRPFIQADHCKTICRESAQDIVSIFRLYDEAFGMSSATYMMAYCAYAGATVAVLDLHEGAPGALQSVSTCLQVLNSTRASCPGVQSGIDIIINGMTAGAKPATSLTSVVPEVLQNTLDGQHLPPTSSTPPTRTDPWLATAFPAFPFESSQAYHPDDNLPRIPYVGSLDPFASEWADFTEVDLDSLFASSN